MAWETPLSIGSVPSELPVAPLQNELLEQLLRGEGRSPGLPPLPSPDEQVALCHATGLSQEDVTNVVSDALGRRISSSTVSRWQSGARRKPRSDAHQVYLALLARLRQEVAKRG